MKRSIFTTLLLVLVPACEKDDDDPTTATSIATSAETGSADDGTDGGESTGGDEVPEEMLCARADECNVLMPGISVADCADLETMCTDDLITSAYADWSAEVDDCLALANCQNFLGCVTDLSVCPPVEPAAQCGPECAYCWFETDLEGMCPPEYDGDGVCDCGCQFTDADC